MQFAEGLSDVQAAEVVRGRIDWKYALGLALTDSGFDASVLSEFRTRLSAGGAQLRLLEGMLARFRGLGLLKAGGRARTGSHSWRKPSGTRSINWLWLIPNGCGHRSRPSGSSTTVGMWRSTGCGRARRNARHWRGQSAHLQGATGDRGAQARVGAIVARHGRGGRGALARSQGPAVWRVAHRIAARLGGAPEQEARHLLDRLQGACDRDV